MNVTDSNKAVVRHFNAACLEKNDAQALREILAADVINHSAMPGMPNGVESFTFFLNEILHKGFSGLKVEILDQVAEGDTVATRKEIHGIHSGEIFGIAPTQKKIQINVIDIIRLKAGKYVEHWGQSNLKDVLDSLK